MLLVWLAFATLVFVLLAYLYAPLVVWTISYAALLVAFSLLSQSHVIILAVIWVLFGFVSCVLNIPKIRRSLLTQYMFKIFKKHMPQMSQTEKEALSAGTVSFEGELFSGRPRFSDMLKLPRARLSEEEQAYAKRSNICTKPYVRAG